MTSKLDATWGALVAVGGSLVLGLVSDDAVLKDAAAGVALAAVLYYALRRLRTERASSSRD